MMDEAQKRLRRADATFVADRCLKFYLRPWMIDSIETALKVRRSRNTTSALAPGNHVMRVHRRMPTQTWP
jgi:hypothetical protein